ncbi:carbamoyltransferase family protein [Synechococcus sp. MIT S9220]|uniref:carbamoyltransferase family protein n=1 Tax=unclassified Synechococcus TaxID=2626047 RepID=UPI00164B2CEC|nr:carbamoyltransferase [Synechococcus sp. MIT S9220]NOL48052.1 carbamoyltransferase [Synechococcus sp. MIT S9220]QNJ21509.1 carbamoyltransferase family protein [Synechococcus sp. MIT S9220]
MRILGISAYFHDSAAALVVDGITQAAAQEERFSRKKHDARFPRQAVRFCLESQGLKLEDCDAVVYYEKPLLTFERLLETYLGAAPRGGRSFVAAMQVWLKEKLFLKTELKKQLQSVADELADTACQQRRTDLPELLFSEHHLSHAGAAFYPSPFDSAAVLCMDGVGEWVTTSAWTGKGNSLKPLWEINFPHSLGLLYSAFTSYCGFKVNSGEYKLMGLAPYGEPRFVEKIKNHLVDIKPDGTFRLDLSYFKFHRGFRMTGRKFHKLFGRPPRRGETELSQFHMDIAASIQVVTEEIVLQLARSLQRETGARNLCLAGGVALNCVANGKLLKEEIFEKIWIQPASGDAGSAIGAALVAEHNYFDKRRDVPTNDGMHGTYLGPSFSNDEISKYLNKINAPYQFISDPDLFPYVAELLNQGKVIGWFNGAMEFGPRSLGARSILGDPRSNEMQSTMNLKIKYRESFRPFAPSVLEEEASNQFDLQTKSPYMLLVAPLRKELCRSMNAEEKRLFGIEKLKVSRSKLPAITHVDYSARVQTVNQRTNPRYYNLIKSFQSLTGCPTLVNTSFNVRGEPIVCTPQDAYRCFMRTEMDVLVLENHLLLKDLQPKEEYDEKWMQEFELD